jgi:hypothetical protein
MNHGEIVVLERGTRGHLGYLGGRQHPEVSLTAAQTAGFKAWAQIMNGGLLSIPAPVSSILLSTTELVHVATRDANSRRLW